MGARSIRETILKKKVRKEFYQVEREEKCLTEREKKYRPGSSVFISLLKIVRPNVIQLG